MLCQHRKDSKCKRTPLRRRPLHAYACHRPAHNASAFVVCHLSNSAVIPIQNKRNRTFAFNEAFRRDVACLSAAGVEEESENRWIVGGQCHRLERRKVSELCCEIATDKHILAFDIAMINLQENAQSVHTPYVPALVRIRSARTATDTLSTTSRLVLNTDACSFGRTTYARRIYVR